MFKNYLTRCSLLVNFFSRWIVVLSAGLILMSLHRLVFFHLFKTGGEWYYFKNDVLQAFALGFRFDLSALAYLAALPILTVLFWTLSSSSIIFPKYFRLPLKHAIALLLTLAVFTLGIDLGFYSFFQDHINVLVFGFLNDGTVSLIKTFWHNYPVVTILASTIAAYLLFFKFVAQWLLQSLDEPNGGIPGLQNQPLAAITPFFIFVLMGLAARGSLTMYPLGVFHTAISQNSFINTLSINGIHSLGHAFEVRAQDNKEKMPNLKFYGYQGRQAQAFVDYFDLKEKPLPENPFELLKKTSAPLNPLKQPHVVLFLMESMGSDWISGQHFPRSLTENLQAELAKHFKDDYVNFNTLPSSGATIGSLGALLINWPHRARGPFLTESEFLRTEFPSAPALIYKKAGYETHFIYGGQLGWREINQFIPRQGFDHLHGQTEILNSIPENISHDTHDWGVFDEAVFNYTETLLKKSTKPQFIFVLTTTNHPPYELPANADQSAVPELSHSLKARKKTLIGEEDLAQKRLICFRYANQQLGSFISGIKNSSLKENTIIAATGDHAFYILPYLDGELYEKWSVPFYVYDPLNRLKNIAKDIPVSHMDLFPTLFDLSLNQAEYSAPGNSLFSKNEKFAVHVSNLLISKDQAVSITATDAFMPWLKNTENNDFSPLTIPMENQKYWAKKYGSLMSIADLYFQAALKKDTRVLK